MHILCNVSLQYLKFAEYLTGCSSFVTPPLLSWYFRDSPNIGVCSWKEEALLPEFSAFLCPYLERLRDLLRCPLLPSGFRYQCGRCIEVKIVDTDLLWYYQQFEALSGHDKTWYWVMRVRLGRLPDMENADLGLDDPMMYCIGTIGTISTIPPEYQRGNSEVGQMHNWRHSAVLWPIYQSKATPKALLVA